MSQFTECIYRNRHGHRLFANALGEISICDDSGDVPEQTDDGPLIVKDGSSCIAGYSKKFGMSVSVPVTVSRRQCTGTVSLIPEDFSALRLLMRRRGHKLVVFASPEFIKLQKKIAQIGEYLQPSN